jgi:hypothetical protein
MNMRLLGGFSLPFSLALFAFPFSPAVFSQTARCGREELKASLPPNAAAYADATALSETLKGHGILVKCILLSKMDGMFEGLSGAALYRTDSGDFEVLFLPQTKTFDHLKIIEQQDGTRFSYSFTGPPQPWPANRIDSAYRMYFIKHQSMLFVLSGKRLTAKLEKIVGSH